MTIIVMQHQIAMLVCYPLHTSARTGSKRFIFICVSSSRNSKQLHGLSLILWQTGLSGHVFWTLHLVFNDIAVVVNRVAMVVCDTLIFDDVAIWILWWDNQKVSCMNDVV